MLKMLVFLLQWKIRNCVFYFVFVVVLPFSVSKYISIVNHTRDIVVY